MPDVLHSATTYVHQPWDSRLEYNSYADLKAGAGLTADMVGHIGLLRSDNSLWKCEQFTPCIKWSRVTGNDITYQDEIWYVNLDTGNDDTGNGDVSFPFQSLHCLDKLVNTSVLHDIKIRMSASDSYDYFPSFLLHKTFEGGRIILDPSGETFPVIESGLVVGSVSGVGDAYAGYETATDVTVTPSPSWTPNEHYPRFIHIKTGNYAGYCLPIFKHDADTIRTSSNWWGLAPGDTFDIVRPPVRITIPGDITIRGNSGDYNEFRGGTVKEAPHTPTLLMAGIELRYNGTRELFGPLKVEKCCLVANFCIFMNEYWEGGNNVDVGYLERSVLNAQEIPATFDHSALDDWYDFHLWIATHENEPHHEAYPDILLKDSVAFGICTRGALGVHSRTSSLAGGHFAYCLAGGIWKDALGQTSCTSVFIEQVDYPVPSQGVVIRSNAGGSLTLDGVYVFNGKQLLKLEDGGSMYASWLKCTVANIVNDYALQMDENSTFIITDAANVTALGQVGAVDFLFSNTQHAAWPTSGNRHIDTDNSIVITK